MKGSVTSSAVVHAALLLAVLVGLPSPEPFKVEPQNAVQVDISNIGDVTKVMATTKEAVPTPEKPAASPASGWRPREWNAAAASGTSTR